MSGLGWESQRVFLAVLRSGSLSGAARLLGIAQATARHGEGWSTLKARWG